MTETPAADTAQPPQDNVRPIREDVADRNASLEIVSGQRWWTAPQLAALASIGLENTPDADRMAFLHLCQSTGLDPFRREIYLLGRKAKQGNDWIVRWTPQTGIDGFRHLAEETGVYGGRVGPFWTGEDGDWRKVWLAKEPPRAARCGVVRTDRPQICRECGAGPGGDTHGVDGRLGDGQHVFDDERITWAVALYDEYVPLEDEYEQRGGKRERTGNKIPTSMWRKMPANQLAKCAEAAAVRAAFPRQAAGLYEHTEMAAADQQAKEAEESERDRQRRELASRSWSPTPTGEKGVVLDGSTPTAAAYDRAALWAELEEQAAAADKTTTQYSVRWAAAHRKNIEDATDEELDAFLAARRTAPREDAQPATTAPAESSAGEETAEHGLAVHDVSRAPAETDGDEDRETSDGQESLIPEDPPEMHLFEVPEGSLIDACAAPGCGQPSSDPIHG